MVLSDDELRLLRGRLERYDWYRSILERFRERVDELDRRRPPVPIAKGRAFHESCEQDAARLSFDPYDQSAHVCPKCGRNYQGEAFDLAWLRQFHDWLGKRLVEAGILYRVGGDERYAKLVTAYLGHYWRHYRDYPLANNLLGPTRLFQSTYLEAFWLVDMVAAYDLVKGSRAFAASDHAAIRELLFESASVVRSFDEGVSNRQAFNNAGMGAVGLLYQDRELIDHVLAGPHGFAFHMRESLLEDGIWYEGENYHFATLEHTLNLAEMARHRGIDLYLGESGYGSLKPMFDGPLKVMLPDLTFPSRKDSWFGRGMEFHRQTYELGYARYREERYGRLLAHAYANGSDRCDIGWRTFLYLEPELPPVGAGTSAQALAHPADVSAVRPRGSERMPGTGVAVLRRDDGAVYASLEYGHYGGGHGHPDRLHLTLFADGVHWLLDPGTGWYHVPELGWYRSTIAHNTVSIDGRLQLPREGKLVAFGEAGGFQAAQATVPELAPGVRARRTVLLGPGFLLDVTDVAGRAGDRARQVDWAFHTVGRFEAAPGTKYGEQSAIGDRDGYEFLRDARSLETPFGRLDLTASHGDSRLRVQQLDDFGAVLAWAPGVPGREEWPLSSVIVRRQGTRQRFATLWSWGPARDIARFEARDDGYRLTVDERIYDFAVAPFDRPEQAGVSVVERLASIGHDGKGETVGASGSQLAGGSRDDWAEGSSETVVAVAWFSLGAWEVPGVAVRSDRELPFGAVRLENDDWRPEFPEGFGEVTVQTDAVLRFQQPPGRELWRHQDGPQPLFAGALNEITFSVGAYGVEPREPVVDLPAGWRLASLERLPGKDERVVEWLVRVEVPSAPETPASALRVSVGEDAFEIPVEVRAPLHTAWHVRSQDGAPVALLEVRDLTATGGEVAYRLSPSWEGGQVVGTQALPADGTATLRLPLPSARPERSIEPVADEVAQLLGVDDLDGEPSGHGQADGRWTLPGLTGNNGDWQLEAELSFGGFTGVTRARLPLVWATQTGGDLALERVEQALWADRRWAGPADARLLARVSLDDGGIRLACRVWDDKHVSDANLDDLYENDSIQVYFDFRSDHHLDRNFSPGVAAYVLAPSADSGSVRIEAIAGNREISNRGARASWFQVEGVTASCSAQADGWSLEAYFPYSVMGVEPLTAGDVIGFDLALSDNDGTWYRNTQLLWSGSRGRRCYIRGSYHDPREFGWLVVGEEG